MATVIPEAKQSATTELEIRTAAMGAAPGNDDNNARTDKASAHNRPVAPSDAATSELVQSSRFSAFTERRKLFIVYTVSLVALLSPLAGSIYYPALPTLARDFGVSETKIQLTITVYQIFQGIAPSFVANFSDSHGRRSAYLIGFIVFLGANIGLALQNSFAALMVLRCVQSSGSSVTVPLAAGTVADISTRSERGKYISYVSLGPSIGPALGPIVGGLIIQNLRLQWIFWFLAIFTGVIAPIYLLFVPETARAVVGDGSVPPPRLLMTPFQYLRRRKSTTTPTSTLPVNTAALSLRKRIDPLAALRILTEREGGITLGFVALVYGGYFMILTTLSTTLTTEYGLDPVKVGLAYLPIFVGTFLSRAVAGRLLDRNFRRHARRAGIELTRGRQTALDRLPIEAARLQVGIPMLYASAAAMIALGWVLQRTHSLAAVEAVLFFVGLFANGALSGLNTLVIDTHQDSPATALAANNLIRCLFSAGCVALTPTLISRVGFGWLGVIIAAVWVGCSPALWMVLLHGKRWREENEARRKKEEEKAKQNRGKTAVT